MVTIKAHRFAIKSYFEILWERQRGFIKIFSYLKFKIIVVLCVRLLIEVVIFGEQLEGGDIDASPEPAYNIQ